MVEIHMTKEHVEAQCQAVGQAELKLAEVVHYPSNKLHGSVLVVSPPQGEHEPKVVGSLDYWFKLHTAATSRIQEWLDHREEVQRSLELAETKPKLASEVDLLQGEHRAISIPENQEKLVGRRRKKSLPEPKQAPKISPTSISSPSIVQATILPKVGTMCTTSTASRISVIWSH